MKRLRPAVRPSRFLLIVSLVLVLVSQTAAVPAAPAGGTVHTIYGLVAPNSLIRFLASSPGTIAETTPITGLPTGTSLLGIDFRVKTGQLYAVGITGTLSNGYGRLYIINVDTGAATVVGSAPFSTTLPTGAFYDIDFNQVVDRVRIVNNFDQNLRVNPNNGALASTDHALNQPSNDPFVVGLAYHRLPPGSGLTTLYGIDWFLDQLVMIGGVNGSPSPNLGVVSQVGPLGLVTQNATIGFDISSDGVAFASLRVADFYRLYTINLSTGLAAEAGPIGPGGNTTYDIAVQPRYTVYLPVIVR